MKHVLEKSVILIILVMLICTGLTNKTYAMDNAIASGDSFIKIGEDENNKNSAIDTDALKTTSNNVYNILFTIGVVIAVAVGLIIGIQFMIASVDEKAKIKETLVPYVIGVFIVAAAFGIWKIAVRIGNSLNYTTTKEEAKNIIDNDENYSKIKSKLSAAYGIIGKDLEMDNYIYDEDYDMWRPEGDYIYDESYKVWRPEDSYDETDFVVGITNQSIIEKCKNNLTQQERVLLMNAGYWDSIRIDNNGKVYFE